MTSIRRFVSPLRRRHREAGVPRRCRPRSAFIPTRTTRAVAALVAIIAVAGAFGAFDGPTLPPVGGAPPLPAAVSYAGSTLVLIGTEANGLTNTTIYFDWDQDGTVDDQTDTDEQADYTLAVDDAILGSNFDAWTDPLARQTVSVTKTAAATRADDLFIAPGVQEMPCICSGCGVRADAPAALMNGNTPVVADTSMYDGFPMTIIDLAAAPPSVAADSRHTGASPAIESSGYPHGVAAVHLAGADLDGVLGVGMLLSYDVWVVRESATAARLTTPGFHEIALTYVSGTAWSTALPGVKVSLDSTLNRWIIEFYNGVVFECYAAPIDVPGKFVRGRSPKFDAGGGEYLSFRARYDGSGAITKVVSDLGRETTFDYDASGRIDEITDPLGRVTTLTYDASGRLSDVDEPGVSYLNIGTNVRPADTSPDSLVTFGNPQRTINYTVPSGSLSGSFVESITDPRGATPETRTYDTSGRLIELDVTGATWEIEYSSYTGVSPLPVLDAGNTVTRVIDPSGLYTDYEIHGAAGGPLSAGAYGLRRRIRWTASGVGTTAIRSGEPDWYAERFLYACDCLAPKEVSAPYSSDDVSGISFHSTTKMPTDWKRMVYTVNSSQQVTQFEVTDGTTSVVSDFTYDTWANHSRLLTATGPLESSSLSIYAGLDFTVTYTYDSKGNLSTSSRSLTRGVPSSTTIAESWTYNNYSQIDTHTDANGNITKYHYHTGTPTSTDINARLGYRTFLEKVQRGYTGSTDSTADMPVQTYYYNAMGRVTEARDANSNATVFELDNHGRTVRELPPSVTTSSGSVSYETKHYFDAAGHPVLSMTKNIDHDGSSPTNTWIYQARAFDADGRVTSKAAEAAGGEAVTRYALDDFGRTIATEAPDGTRSFVVFDERGKVFRNYFGVAGTTGAVDAGYPSTPAGTPTAAYVGRQQYDYTSFGTVSAGTDALSNTTTYFYDGLHRLTATRDPNGNGSAVAVYDGAGNALTIESGEISTTGVVTSVLAREYRRFDELGRRYMQSLDDALTTTESSAVDPGGATATVTFDAGSRVTSVADANGVTRTRTYDAAGRTLRVTDAVGNYVDYTYDENSKVTEVTRHAYPGADAFASSADYVTEFHYDELGRLIAKANLGLGGLQPALISARFYDSRGNTRMTVGPAGRARLVTYDELGLPTRTQLYDGDPTGGGATELARTESEYDANGRTTIQRVWSDIPANVYQETHHAYDDAGRLVRIVHPDSDDPITGGNGADGIWDRIEFTYYATGRLAMATDQRRIEHEYGYDSGSRLTLTTISGAAVGETQREFDYDALNRLVEARNDYSLVHNSYDDLGRLTTQRNEIRLDGSGFTNGWQEPIAVAYTYDAAGHRSRMEVNGTDVVTEYDRDAANRIVAIDAQFFGFAMQDAANYAYIGQRVDWKEHGIGSWVDTSYDAYGRIAEWSYYTPGAVTRLTGGSYGHDDDGNVLYERMLHDSNLYDAFGYNTRNELVGVDYRSTSPTYSGAGDAYSYDSNTNRLTQNAGDPFNNEVNRIDAVTHNAANELSGITNTQPLPAGLFTPVYDRAGNMTSAQTTPASGPLAGVRSAVAVDFDAFNRPVQFAPTAAPTVHVRTDALGRRIARYEITAGVVEGRRYIHDGSSCVEERVFVPVGGEGPTEANAGSVLERIYVHGIDIDEPVLCAIDGDLDGSIATNVNALPWTDWPSMPMGAAEPVDFMYFFAENGTVGNIMALLAPDAETMALWAVGECATDRSGWQPGSGVLGRSVRPLEYYRYQTWGTADVYPIVDADGNGMEDTPATLADNNALMMANRAARGDFGRWSLHCGNEFMFQARRLDDETGMVYMRRRYLLPAAGTMLSRDSAGMNRYATLFGNPVSATSPAGSTTPWYGGATSCYSPYPPELWDPLKPPPNHSIDPAPPGSAAGQSPYPPELWDPLKPPPNHSISPGHPGPLAYYSPYPPILWDPLRHPPNHSAGPSTIPGSVGYHSPYPPILWDPLRHPPNHSIDPCFPGPVACYSPYPPELWDPLKPPPNHSIDPTLPGPVACYSPYPPILWDPLRHPPNHSVEPGFPGPLAYYSPYPPILWDPLRHPPNHSISPGFPGPTAYESPYPPEIWDPLKPKPNYGVTSPEFPGRALLYPSPYPPEIFDPLKPPLNH
jgi:RHS repeat-associated protein